MIVRALILVLLVVAATARADRMSDLLVILREGQSDQRSEACDALVMMGPAVARRAVPDLIAALRDRHWKGRSAAPRALLQIAPDDPAVRAALAEAAGDPKEDVREAIAYALEDHAPQTTLKEMIPLLVRLLGDKESLVAWEAAAAIGRLGPDGAAAAPALLEAMKREDSGMRLRAASALGRIGGEAAKPAVPMLRKMLGSSEKFDRSNAARVLGELGAIGAEGTPELTKALADGEPVVRLQAAFALGRLRQPASVMAGKDQQLRTAFDIGAILATGGTDNASVLKLLEAAKNDDVDIRILANEAAVAGGGAAVPALIAALESADDEIRSGAALALGSLAFRSGVHADAAVAALALRLSKDPDPATRGMVGSALLRFRSPRALSALLEAIKSNDWDTRADAAMALGGLKNDPASVPLAVAALTATLNDGEPWVRSMAARTLGEFGAAAKDATPRLIEMLEDHTSTEIVPPPPRRPMNAHDKRMLEEALAMTKRGQVRDGIATTLGRIGPDARAAAPALIADAKWDRAAIEALGRIGPDAAAAAVPVLAGLLKDARLSFYAAPALARIGGAGATALVAALKDKDAQYAAREALARGGGRVVAALAAGLSDADPEARAAVVKAPGEIGPLAAGAAPALLKSVEADDDRSRQVLEALAQMGSAAMPSLNDALTNSSAKVRLVAVQGLMRLGAAAKPALPGLRKIVRGDPDEGVKNAAADALRAIGPGE